MFNRQGGSNLDRRQHSKALFNPVWAQVRTPAPWEAADPLLQAPTAEQLAAEVAPA